MQLKPLISPIGDQKATVANPSATGAKYRQMYAEQQQPDLYPQQPSAYAQAQAKRLQEAIQSGYAGDFYQLQQAEIKAYEDMVAKAQESMSGFRMTTPYGLEEPTERQQMETKYAGWKPNWQNLWGLVTPQPKASQTMAEYAEEKGIKFPEDKKLEPDYVKLHMMLSPEARQAQSMLAADILSIPEESIMAWITKNQRVTAEGGTLPYYLMRDYDVRTLAAEIALGIALPFPSGAEFKSVKEGINLVVKLVKEGAKEAPEMIKALNKAGIHGFQAEKIVDEVYTNFEKYIKVEEQEKLAQKLVEQYKVAKELAEKVPVDELAWTEQGVQKGMLGQADRVVQKPMQQGNIFDILKKKEWEAGKGIKASEQIGALPEEIAKIEPMPAPVKKVVPEAGVTKGIGEIKPELELLGKKGMPEALTVEEIEAKSAEFDGLLETIRNDPLYNKTANITFQKRLSSLDVRQAALEGTRPTPKAGVRKIRIVDLLTDKYGKCPEAVTPRTFELLNGDKPLKSSILKSGKVDIHDALDGIYSEYGFASSQDMVDAIESLKRAMKRAKGLADELPVIPSIPKAKASRGMSLEEMLQKSIEAEEAKAGKVGPPYSFQKEAPTRFQAPMAMEGEPLPLYGGKVPAGKVKGPKRIPGQPHLPGQLPETLQKKIDEINAQHPNIEATNVQDQMASIYAYTGDIDATIEAMSITRKLKPDEARELGVLVVKNPKAGGEIVFSGKGGNYIPANVLDAEGNFKIPINEINYVSAQFEPPGGLFKNMDQGRFGGLLQRNVKWGAEKAKVSVIKFHEGYVKKMHDMIESLKLGKAIEFNNGFMFDLMEEIGHDDLAQGIKKIISKDNVLDVLRKYDKGKGKYIDATGKVTGRGRDLMRAGYHLREMLDDMIVVNNMFRQARGQKLIQYREAYMPWIRLSNIFSRTFGVRAAKKVLESGMLPDYIKPGKPFNARELARANGLGDYDKQIDVYRLITDYALSTAKDIFYTGVIDNCRLWARLLEVKGYRSNARIINEWASEAFAGMLPKVSRTVRSYVPGPIYYPMMRLRSVINPAILGMNIKWNLIVQPSSLVFTFARAGIKNTVNGVEAIFNTAMRSDIMKNCYSAFTKSKGSSIVREGIDTPTILMTKAENIATFLTRFIEDTVTVISCRAGFLKGQQMGLEGRALWSYASEMGARTQGMYNLEDLPGILRNKEIGLLAPFQTFSMEALNMVREMTSIKVLRAGEYKTISAASIEGQSTLARRLRMALIWIGGMLTVNAVADRLTGQKPWTLSSYVPFFSIQMSGIDPYNDFNQTYIQRYVSGFWDGFTAILQYGNYDKLIKWTMVYHMPGGNQLYRTFQAYTALLNEGEVRDVRGEEIFKFATDNPLMVAKALVFGVYTTPEGMEKVKEMDKGKGGLFYDIVGVPIPQITNKKDLLDNESLLGMVTDDKTRFTLQDYGQAIYDWRQHVGVYRFNREATPLAKFWFESNEMWNEQYYSLPASERETFRMKNPDVEARLFLFGKLTVLRNPASTEYVQRYIKQYNIPENSLREEVPKAETNTYPSQYPSQSRPITVPRGNQPMTTPGIIPRSPGPLTVPK